MHDVDLDLIEGAWPHRVQPTAKTRSSMGLLRRLALPGVPMYGRKFTVDEVEALLREYYDHEDAVVEHDGFDALARNLDRLLGDVAAFVRSRIA